ncbi:hypothetical protein MSG28_002869 [Choristoneura fumiferana]|uniref:Uncharacterized protein n=1 Tax=Choristoneura fumiferana TaxID=7141 RepID=A0ACC0JJK8_CHOFU|nr:hypothetical protein MSG28_002869 [Choristoneura fumiferana]
MIDWYGDYAKIAFELFGDRVKFWITVNEPHLICHRGYGSTTMAPRLNMQGTGEYLCAKNLMLAHARAWHIYNDEYRSLQKGNISIYKRHLAHRENRKTLGGVVDSGPTPDATKYAIIGRTVFIPTPP